MFSTKKVVLMHSDIISLREWWYRIRKPHCGDPENPIMISEMYSIKTWIIDGYSYDKIKNFRHTR
jgi:hypothetical protein